MVPNQGGTGFVSIQKPVGSGCIRCKHGCLRGLPYLSWDDEIVPRLKADATGSVRELFVGIVRVTCGDDEGGVTGLDSVDEHQDVGKHQFKEFNDVGRV